MSHWISCQTHLPTFSFHLDFFLVEQEIITTNRFITDPNLTSHPQYNIHECATYPDTKPNNEKCVSLEFTAVNIARRFVPILSAYALTGLSLTHHSLDACMCARRGIRIQAAITTPIVRFCTSTQHVRWANVAHVVT